MNTPNLNNDHYDISVVILNYNVRDFLENALNSVYRAVQELRVEIFVVDNASSDGSVEMVRQKFPDVRLIVNKKNLGFAAGNNLALRQCRGKYILVLNPDTLIQENTLMVMKQFMDRHPEAGAAGCKVLNPDGTLQLSCKRAFPSPWVAFTKIAGLSRLFPKSPLFGRYNLTYLSENETHEVEALAGSFMFLRREVLDTAGYLDEAYFMYGEDLDWCYRIWKAGWKIYYVPETQIIHYKGESTSRSGFDDIRLFYEAMEIFVEKHFKKTYSFWMIGLLKLAIFFRAFLAKVYRAVKIAWMPLLDVVAIQSSVLLAIWVKYGAFITPDWIGTPLFFYSTILLTTSLVWLMTLYFLNNYGQRKLSISQSILASVIGFFIISTISLFSKEFIFSRLVVLLTFIFALISITGWRILALLMMKKGARQRLWATKIFKRSTLIIGGDVHTVELIRRIREKVDSPYHIVGVVIPQPDDSIVWPVPVLGTVEELPDLIVHHKVTEILMVASSLSNRQVMQYLQMMNDLPVNVRLAPSGGDVLIGKSYISRLEPVPLVSLQSLSNDPLNRFLKRMLDLSAGFWMTLGFLFPFILRLITGRIKRAKWHYLNYQNKTVPVHLWISGKHQLHPFSRAMLLLSGHFSLVGPPAIWLKTEPNEPSHYPYLSRKPGLISLYDVMADEYSGDDPTLPLSYDFYYAHNYSFKMDLEIILRRLLKI